MWMDGVVGIGAAHWLSDYVTVFFQGINIESLKIYAHWERQHTYIHVMDLSTAVYCCIWYEYAESVFVHPPPFWGRAFHAHDASVRLVTAPPMLTMHSFLPWGALSMLTMHRFTLWLKMQFFSPCAAPFMHNKMQHFSLCRAPSMLTMHAFRRASVATNLYENPPLINSTEKCT